MFFIFLGKLANLPDRKLFLCGPGFLAGIVIFHLELAVIVQCGVWQRTQAGKIVYENSYSSSLLRHLNGFFCFRLGERAARAKRASIKQLFFKLQRTSRRIRHCSADLPGFQQRRTDHRDGSAGQSVVGRSAAGERNYARNVFDHSEPECARRRNL